MSYEEKWKNLMSFFRKLFSRRNTDLHPKDILDKLFKEMERKKKLGIEEKAYVPNIYKVYLSRFDYDEISTLLSGIREQLKNRLTEKVKMKGYKLLSSPVTLEIIDDPGLIKNQVVIESLFLKEKSWPVSVSLAGLDIKENWKKSANSFSPQNSASDNDLPGGEPGVTITGQPENSEGAEMTTTLSSKMQIAPDACSNASGGTKIIEEKKTKLIDFTRVRLEVVEGGGKGEIIALRDGAYTFGRGREAEYLLKDTEDTISRLHFKIFVKKDQFRIKDLGSTNGTRINDIGVEEAELRKGDMISAGKLLLKVA
ncbi:MAG: hypothetical protein BWK74_05295 [Desulfobacteraceae bacterium A6]|nr:MAG: hypothetical protein BWK74_05295 [Desulfobacteraceae bacterium A6]